MALTALQRAIMASIAKNRSETSYLAGGLVLNRDWPRLSDDIDIFHDTDEEIGPVAERDMKALRTNGFIVSVDVLIYGCVEASVSRDGESTLIQWMSESRYRFFPLIRDDEWGARLHQSDLAINKVLAASTRRKARDYVDLVMIAERYCPLGPLMMAAAGKPPHYSPVRIIDEIRHRGLSMASEEYQSVKGLPEEYDAAAIRQKLEYALDRAETYVRSAPPDIVGLLAADSEGFPVEISGNADQAFQLRRATSEPEIVPAFPEKPADWGGHV
ncbi:hypothetical protein ACFFP0_21195 [Rhizobium puerariae]|uniref:Nucleotidyl transferase AbiEii/AbiGii toxin family protein n=1 Tax=Rhizobium puerariae TaxID=1585791 RepID=A0ABV6ALF2_9HYPH